MVRTVSANCIVTASLDKWVKVWHIPDGALIGKTEDIVLVARFKAEKELMQLKYSPDEKLLAYLDSDCTVGSVFLSDALVNNTVVASKESVEAEVADDIDLDAIDAAMIEDDDALIDNIDMDDMQDAMPADKPAEAVA